MSAIKSDWLRVLSMLGLVTMSLLYASNAHAQSKGDDYLELLRSDLKTQKVALLTTSMAFTSEQAEVFWPIYREYQLAASTLGDEQVAPIKYFAEHFENLSDDKAEEIAKRSFKLQEEKLKLMKKTHRKIAKALGPKVAGRFVQVENVINRLIDVQIGAELPLMQ